MAKLPGLYEREGVYQLRVMVPTDLRPHYGGRSRLVESLGATDPRRKPQTAPGRPAVPSGSLSSMSDASETPRNGSSVKSRAWQGTRERIAAASYAQTKAPGEAPTRLGSCSRH